MSTDPDGEPTPPPPPEPTPEEQAALEAALNEHLPPLDFGDDPLAGLGDLNLPPPPPPPDEEEEEEEEDEE